ncbi:MAG: bifunctional folylpolyglutamate synthase/dihydrofolate synthase [Saprospiraceae bacterium]|nr:bifunctional folylpolyglutamate synthase/dihydrofolate synthase [Saprospiraceae bacterium]
MFPIKSYKSALSYIFAKLPMYHRVGQVAYKKDLTNTIQLCEAAGNPQDKIKTIHIAGTNGKGTTTHIIAGGLQSQGYKVGVYTSPHYKDFRERIKINGQYITSKFIVNFLNKHHETIELVDPSFFEVTVAMAFAYFESEKVDFAIIETGLGGRLDSTNIINPLLSVITNISYDHQNLLGDTLQAIAGEKAGIIKEKVPILIGERQSEVEQVFIDKAKTMSAPITFAEDNLKLTLLQSANGTKEYQAKYQDEIWLKSLKTTISGPFQDKNLVTGLCALKMLSKQIEINDAQLMHFFPDLIQKTAYMGRWQVLGQRPLIIADSAHNEGGLKLVINELTTIKKTHLHIVMGFVNDKDLSKVLALFPKDATYYFAKANIPRGLEASVLQTVAKEFQLIGKSYTSVNKAFAAAHKKAQPEDLIFVGGSIFVVAEVL